MTQNERIWERERVRESITYVKRADYCLCFLLFVSVFDPQLTAIVVHVLETDWNCEEDSRDGGSHSNLMELKAPPFSLSLSVPPLLE